MKKITIFPLVLMIILGFFAMALAQEQKATPAKEPAKTPPKAVVAKKAKTEKEHMKWSEGEVTEVQNALISAGFLKEKATGKMDQNTKQALEDYQKANNLKVTGTPDKETREKLGIKKTAPAATKKETVKKPAAEPVKK
jgi:peptidoglycan hydrolase-like protein with peptidoglycan-binding domain